MSKDNKLEQLKGVLELVNRDVPSTKEVAEIIATVIKAVKEAKEELSRRAESNRGEIREIAKEAASNVGKVERELLGKFENLKRQIKEDNKEELGKLSREIFTELRAVENLIPSPTDFSKIFEEIAKVGERIPELPTNLVNEERLEEEIKTLEEKLEIIKKEIPRASSGGTRRIFQPYLDRFTSETDGSNKTFYLSREPLRTDTIKVWGTDFPIILDPTVDFTVSGKTLTLTDAVPAPSEGATLLIEYYA